MKLYLFVIILFTSTTFANYEEFLQNYMTRSLTFRMWENEKWQTLIESGGEDVMVRKEALISSLWEKVIQKREKQTTDELELIDELKISDFSPMMGIRLLALKKYLSLNIPLEEEQELFEIGQEIPGFIYTYLNLKDYLGENWSDQLNRKRGHRKHIGFYKQALSQNQWDEKDLKRLLDFTPKNIFQIFSLRKYLGGVKLFLFCRENREFPCLMIMKDKWGNFVKDQNGEYWSQQKLGLSKYGIPATESNGNTPQGVFTIDSVMPKADKQYVYGKFRRLKLDFVESSRGERKLLSLFPKNLQQYNWWRENVVARDIGRNLLRVHGTGTINTDPQSNWYPFYPTSGCVASRENEYDGETFTDQRQLLDVMMRAQGLSATYENEPNLLGLLYVVNVNNEQRAVTKEDIFPLID